jgi:hypothetical protein
MSPKAWNGAVNSVNRVEAEIGDQRREDETLGLDTVEEVEAVLHKYGHLSVLEVVRKAVDQCKAEVNMLT